MVASKKKKDEKEKKEILILEVTARELVEQALKIKEEGLLDADHPVRLRIYKVNYTHNAVVWKLVPVYRGNAPRLIKAERVGNDK